MTRYYVEWWGGHLGWLPDTFHLFEWTARRALGKRVASDARARRWRVVEAKRVRIADLSTYRVSRLVVECRRMTPRTRRPKSASPETPRAAT